MTGKPSQKKITVLETPMFHTSIHILGKNDLIMSGKNLETELFAQAIQRVQKNLKFLDLKLDEGSRRKSIWESIRFKWHFWFNMFLLNVATVGETAWLVKGISTGKSFIELCYQAPCLTLCIVCDIQCAYFVKHTHRILDLVESIRTLQSMSATLTESDEILLKSQVNMFNMVLNVLTVTKVLAISSFGLIPFLTLYLSYHRTGEMEFVLPFFIIYPFDATVINFWPIAYVHQIWADTYFLNEEMKINFKKIIHRHRKLIKCVDEMKEVYSESNLFNAVISSILICFTGFNAMTIDDLALAVPFLPFLLMDLLQIFFICYYGDMIMRYSTSISDAVYECQWYRAEAAIVKDFLFLSLRAQKPCHLTALRFTDISLRTFTRILSTSWSYFALLKSMYRS
ncbi:odorant receptor 67c-like [Bicyclus anynana]|uniref:Odorant receptor n=1 Tax=Bicyclus anynana TaxID=110368 RepID=A0ABM3LGE8_BICAN|nr:odorant receptor 67c-like [Bicyclus anynana]